MSSSWRRHRAILGLALTLAPAAAGCQPRTEEYERLEHIPERRLRRAERFQRRAGIAAQDGEQFACAGLDALPQRPRSSLVDPSAIKVLWPDHLPGSDSPGLLEAFDLEESGQFEEAERRARSALERDPGNLAARYLLGRMAQDRHEIAAAEQHYRAVLAGSPGLSYCWSNLGILLVGDGRLEEGLTAMDTASALMEEPFHYRNRGLALMEAGLPGAEWELCRAAELAPEEGDTFWALAELASGRGESGEEIVHRLRFAARDRALFVSRLCQEHHMSIPGARTPEVQAWTEQLPRVCAARVIAGQ